MSRVVRHAGRRPGPQIVAYARGRLGAREAVLAAARAAGCTCEPDIILAAPHAYARHDAWCALLRREDRS